ncbi:MAG: fructose-1,6-bisphosphatase I [Planctomycetota bacterium]|jgi:fructose-1,6-bisphosphatase I
MPATQPEADQSRESLLSIQAFLLQEEARHPEATGRLTWILSALSLATKYISARCRRARLEDVLGSLDQENVQGEVQQKLDVIANETLLRCLGSRSGLAIVASEENEEPFILHSDAEGERPYIVLFDPLDGSSNLDTCGTIGTIFSVLHHDRRADPIEDAVLQPGVTQVAAGYVVYGPSTILVLTTGNGVQMFVLDPSIGSFLMVESNVRIPESSKTYSTNEAYTKTFPQPYQDYLDWAHDEGYSSRYAGAMVADVHRIMMKGGVFMYPPTLKSPDGKLRLMYEANPMAMLVEQAGGKSFCGDKRTLEVQPEALHQRTSVVMGSANEVDRVLSFLQKK